MKLRNDIRGRDALREAVYNYHKMAPAMAQKLRLNMGGLEVKTYPILTFRYGWGERGSEMLCSVNIDNPQKEISRFIGFINEAERSI